MTEKKKQIPPATSLKQLVEELLPGGSFATYDNAIKLRKIGEVAELLWMPKGASEEDMQARFIRALDLFESIAPQDGTEGMLATQMVGTHYAALECMRRAALPDQTFAGRDMALKHGQKLMTLYLQQLTALNKHRGRGQQKVTVEYVNVEAGGQAIVGNVETSGKTAESAEAPDPKALENKPSMPAPIAARKKSKKKR